MKENTKGKHDCHVYPIERVNNFKEMIDRSCKKYANHIAYKFKINLGKENQEIVEIKYSQVKTEIEGLGTALLNMGLEGKKVAIISNNRYEWCVSYLTLTTSNMVAVPLDKMLPEQEIESLLSRAKVDAVIYENKYNDIFENIKKQGNTTLKYYINMDIDDDENNMLSFNKLVLKGREQIEKGDKKYSEIIQNTEKMAVLLFTSGTTDKSKGVMLSQKNIITNIMGMAQMSKMYDTDVILSFLPLHHTFECTISFLYGFYSGVTIAFCDGLKYLAQNLKEYQATDFVAVPLVLETIYKKIQKGIKEKGKEKLVNRMGKICNFLLKFNIDIRRKVFKSVLDELGGKMRILYYGAAAMDKEVIKGYEMFGIESVQGYGLTETAPLVSAETDKEHCPGSVGIAPEEIEIKIDSPDEKGVGEVLVKGPNVMLGYYENEKATQEAIVDGWFHTGDLGYKNEEGYLFITGRIKEVIVLKNGENVYPTDIEFLVNKLPYVKESMLFPRENSKKEFNLGIKIVYDKDEMMKIFGDKKENEYKKLVWEDIKKINSELSQFKRVKELILTDEELEKTTTRKVKRYKEIEKILKSK